jgi:hypothetical protein
MVQAADIPGMSPLEQMEAMLKWVYPELVRDYDLAALPLEERINVLEAHRQCVLKTEHRNGKESIPKWRKDAMDEWIASARTRFEDRTKKRSPADISEILQEPRFHAVGSRERALLLAAFMSDPPSCFKEGWAVASFNEGQSAKRITHEKPEKCAIPSRLSKKAFVRIQDIADAEQVMWELAYGYEWPEGHALDAQLSQFPEGQTKEWKHAMLEDRKYSERRLQGDYDQLRKDFVTEFIEEWLTSFKVALKQSIREQVKRHTPYQLLRDNMHRLTRLKENLPEGHKDREYFENYALVQLWRDFISGRFTLDLPLPGTDQTGQNKEEDKSFGNGDSESLYIALDDFEEEQVYYGTKEFLSRATDKHNIVLELIKRGGVSTLSDIATNLRLEGSQIQEHIKKINTDFKKAAKTTQLLIKTKKGKLRLCFALGQNRYLAGT